MKTDLEIPHASSPRPIADVVADLGLPPDVKLGLDRLPVCIAKTQSSVTDDSRGGGLPTEHTVHIREIEIAAGAGFVVPIVGLS